MIKWQFFYMTISHGFISIRVLHPTTFFSLYCVKSTQRIRIFFRVRRFSHLRVHIVRVFLVINFLASLIKKMNRGQKSFDIRSSLLQRSITERNLAQETSLLFVFGLHFRVFFSRFICFYPRKEFSTKFFPIHIQTIIRKSFIFTLFIINFSKEIVFTLVFVNKFYLSIIRRSNTS